MLSVQGLLELSRTSKPRARLVQRLYQAMQRAKERQNYSDWSELNYAWRTMRAALAVEPSPHRPGFGGNVGVCPR